MLKANLALSHILKETGIEDYAMNKDYCSPKDTGNVMFCIVGMAEKVTVLLDRNGMRLFCKGWGSIVTA